MSDKKLQHKMDEHITNTRWDIKAALQRFEDIGVKVDRRFQRDFIKRTTDCVIDTCERYCSKRRNKSTRREKTPDRLTKDDDKKGSKHQQTMKNGTKEKDCGKPSEKCNAIKRSQEKSHSPDKNDSCKRRKETDVTDAGSSEAVDVCKNLIVKTEPTVEHQPYFFYCAHCLDTNDSGESVGGSIDDVYKHWHSSHIIHLSSKPFQFNVAQIAVCQFGDAIGTFRELLKHQEQVHMNEPLAIVSYEDRTKCGICLKSAESMADHFDAEHKIVKKDIFNPMRISDEKLIDLLSIDIHKKRQCGHCDAIFETEQEIDIHHSIGHEDKEKISRLYVDNRCPFLICGYCQSKVDRQQYLCHVRSHPYVYKCWKCAYQTDDLIDLILHDKQIHEINTLNYHCQMFSDWLNSHFNNTKMIFSNGLAMKNYNLIGTQFDDSKLFGVFLDGQIELIRSKFLLLEKVSVEMMGDKDRTELGDKGFCNEKIKPNVPDDPAFLHAELNKQNELAKNLLILKMPRLTNMDARDMFMKLCTRLHVNVTGDAIQQAYKRNDDIVICLNSYELKEEIRNAGQKQTVLSGDLFDLTPEQWSKPIKVVSHTTRYYSDMLSIAREARAERIIFHYELTKQGIQIKRSPTSEERIFISKTELLQFVRRPKRE